MFGLLEAWWLLGLALIPLVWWLHRWQAPLGQVRVSALFLWQGIGSSETHGRERRSPDPAWLRRAVIVALIVAALAQPWWSGQDRHVTVWIDDGPSMYTLENRQSRLQDGLDKLQPLLAKHSAEKFLLRSVHDPARQSTLTASGTVDAGIWEEPAGGSLVFRPAMLSSDSEHWLLSDGASASTRRWASRAPFSRVISIGTRTENAAITRLAVRRDAQFAGRLAVLVDVANRGTVSTRRELRVGPSPGAEQVFNIELAAGELQQIELTLDTPHETLHARLLPNDALIIDDEISLDLDRLLPITAAIDPACPAALDAALQAHPGLRTGSNGQALFAIRCSDAMRGDIPQILFHPGPAELLTSAPVALPRAQPLQDLYLQAEWIQARSWPRPPAINDAVLLRNNAGPLILQRAGTATLESVIDPGFRPLTEQPAFPVLLAGMINTVLQRDVLDPVLTVQRDPADTDIIPRVIGTQGGQQAALRLNRFGVMDWLVALALLLLMLDAARLIQAARGTGHA